MRLFVIEFILTNEVACLMQSQIFDRIHENHTVIISNGAQPVNSEADKKNS